MLIFLLIFAFIRTLRGVPLSSPLETPNIFTELDPRETQEHFGQRGVNDIVISCFATIFACTWTAIHPNIPAVTDSVWTCFKRRATIMACALIAPEMMIWWAMKQRAGAKKVMDEYNKVINNVGQNLEENRDWPVFGAISGLFRESSLPSQLDEGKGPQWTLAHGFFLQMGGFMLCERGTPVRTLSDSTWEGKDDKAKIIWNIQNGIIDPPRILEEDIEDRGKGDAIAKTFIILQTIWFIAQCIARWSERLPVTELEVVTLGFAMLNGVTYGLWWHKPQHVGRPVFLESKKSLGNSGDRTSDPDPEDPPPLPNSDSDNPSRLGDLALTPTSQGNSGGRTSDPGDRPPLPQSDGDDISWPSCLGFTFLGIICIIPAAVLSPVVGVTTAIGKMLENGKMSTMRVGMFYSAKPDTNATLYATAAISILFGSVHLIPAWSLDFPSRPEKLLWRISAIFITANPMAVIYLYSLTACLLEISAEQAMGLVEIGLPLYPAMRLVLLILSLTTLRSLPPAALQTIEWTTFIPHL